ncbi:MAG: hypothetical protein ABIN83_01145 [Sphingomicrobium sp.]
MTHKTHQIRMAVAALAAVAAISSTRLLAQTATEAVPPAAVDPVIAAPEVVPEPAIASEPTAVDPVTPAKTSSAVSQKKPDRAPPVNRSAKVAPPARIAPAPVPRAVAAPVQQAAPEAASATVPVAEAPVAMPVAAPAEAVAPQPSPVSNNLLMIGGAIGLALLALIAFAVGMRRRKSGREEEEGLVSAYEPVAAAEVEPVEVQPSTTPIEQYEPVAPVVMASAPATGLAGSDSEALQSPCDDTAPGSHVEAACAGPTADNPSLSIKKRLKRARFFDQREFLVAAGEVAPMAADAGLPDSVEAPVSPESNE